jgi:peptide/nickel transport system substrate-binding protein
MEGMGTPQGQMVTSNIFGFNPAVGIPTPNIQRARELLAQAGFPNGFRMPVNFTNDRLPGDRGVGTALAQMLARIGIEVQAAGQPAAVIFPQRARGELSNIMAGWGTLTGEASYTYSSNFHTNNPQLRLGAFNWHGYSNPEMDRMIQASEFELDDAKRREILQQIGAFAARERITLPLASVNSAWALRRDRATMSGGRADEETYAWNVTPVAAR